MPALVAGMSLCAQPVDSTDKGAGRQWLVGGGAVAGLGATMVGLDHAWYQGYDRAPFHTFDDSGEWLQMDKLGHAWTTYTITGLGHRAFRWAGVQERRAVWYGAAVSMAFLTGIEYLDGRSAEWGFSWSDMAANTIGTGLYVGQQLGWGEQRLQLKYSAHLTGLATQRPDLLGGSVPERVLKDYNGATVWLSGNLRAFGCAAPAWLNVAVGHGAYGMLNGNDHPDAYRRWFLAPDLALARLPVKGRGWRTVLFLLDHIKVPLPALEVTGRGRVRGHWLYF